MRKYPKQILVKQRGAATLVIAVLLVISGTFLTFLAAKTVLQETKMTANNHRTQQAFSAADGAMEFAVAYFNNGGLDHDRDGCLDAGVDEESDVDCDGDGIVIAGLDVDGDGDNDILEDFPHLPDGTFAIEFDNFNVSCSTSGDMKGGLIITRGTSDDGTASRTVSQCVGTRNLVNGDGPKQTLVSGGATGLTGSGQVINRYNDLNIWSADEISIGNSSAVTTYIRPTDIEIEDLTREELVSLDTVPTIPNAQKVSSKGLGGGTDVYMNDTRLAVAMLATAASTNGDGCDEVDVDGDGVNDCTFFGLFFTENKATMIADAEGIDQKFEIGTTNSDLDGLIGVVWVEGDVTVNTATIGTVDDPALLFVNGDFTFSGGTIYGMLYVMGDITVIGNPKVQGSLTIEGVVAGGGGAAGGTPTFVYARSVSDSDAPLKGTTALIAGSWRDWLIK